MDLAHFILNICLWYICSYNLQVIIKIKTAFFGPLSKIPGPFIGRWTPIVLKYYTLSGRRIQYIDSLFTKYGKWNAGEHTLWMCPDTISGQAL